MLTIGQLARCHGLSTKTLRHYDSIGLFRPALTGRDNGYRYYLPAQVAELGRIVMLRELGLPLDEIAKLLPADEAALRRALREHAARLRDEIEARRERIARIERRLDQTEWSQTMIQTPDIVALPTFRVVGLAWSPQDEGDIPAMWQRFLEREHEIADARPGSSYGLCQPLPDGGWRYLAALQTAPDAPVPDGMAAVDVPAQRYARFRHVGPVSGLSATFQAIHGSWLPAAGLEAMEGIEFEYMDARFLAPDHPDSLTELYIPIR
ncbi:MerR family transcriptional regulator [Chromobacterium violaceum]|uniref:MerR family transcriptional regulator n=1 Tax=Chromobacterium violaceum TaxID=536 RepID=UPI0009DAA4D8|nr:GyrI-like domain-containing protein [Chromobacterium violaceum]OQS11026.1 MerR family transcriptional regulator [Chromobacterium violaceum]OQS30202.1 MerR family transcriptional regulator [Chromobacterium violaceum]